MATALRDRLEGATDRLNPILVKELRQALRARVFLAAFAGLLGLCVFVSLTMSLRSDDSSIGRDLFLVYLAGLVIATLLIVPLNVFRSFSRELGDETWPSLALTPLGARRIVRGRIASAAVQSALYASAVGPFLFFSYMLQGVGLASIFVSLGLVALAQPLLTAFAVCGAALSQHRVLRGLLLIGMFGALISLAGSGIGLAGSIVRFAPVPSDWREALGWIALVAASVTLTVLLSEVAAARIATASENTARGPRLALLAHLALPLAGCFVFYGGTEWSGASLAAFAYALAFAFLFGAIGLGEPAVAPVAVRPTSRWTLLVPGARGSLRFAVVVALAPALVLLPLHEFGDEDWPYFVAGPALVTIHLSLWVIVMRWLPWFVRVSPDARRLVPFVLIALTSIAPPLVNLVLLSTPDEPVSNLLNPFVVGYHVGEHEELWIPLLLLALAPLAFLLADRALARDERAALAQEAARA